MTHAKSITAALLLSALAASGLQAQDVRYFEKDGIRYQETRQVLQRPITETRYEQRESTIMRERYTTDMQEVQRTYQVPVTEQQWVPGYQRTWNLFAPPVLSYRLMPITRWEMRSETVRIPVTKREVIPEKQVQQIPVTNTRLAEEEIVRRSPLGTVTNGTAAVARSDTSSSSNSDLNSNNDGPRDDSQDQISRRR
jgi:hypothetical protein